MARVAKTTKKAQKQKEQVEVIAQAVQVATGTTVSEDIKGVAWRQLNYKTLPKELTAKMNDALAQYTPGAEKQSETYDVKLKSFYEDLRNHIDANTDDTLTDNRGRICGEDQEVTVILRPMRVEFGWKNVNGKHKVKALGF